MSISQNDLFSVDELPSSAFVLTHLDLYNWGPFGGRHCAEIDPKGTAIIGPTGSGKTTLVDALMTLITHQPRYNLASTGGHESDRDLMSYIRGVSGAGNNSGDNAHVARPGKTITAVSARFSNGDSSGKDPQAIRIGALFWVDSSGSSVSDMKRLWLFSDRDDQPLDDWLAIHHEGGARALKQLGRDTPGLQIQDSKKAYLAHVRRFFEVGENAFTLLNRAAGLKQLNSIDEIFRELVLDDNAAFNRAAEVAGEFDDLAAIHSELETARRQHQSLLPIAATYRDHQSVTDELMQQRTLQTILPIWYALAGSRLWGNQGDQFHVQSERYTARIDALNATIDSLQANADTLKDIYLQAGGASIEQLKGQIDSQQRWVSDREQNARNYQTLVGKLGLESTLTPEALASNQQQGQAQQQQLTEVQQDQTALDLGVAQQQQTTSVDALKDEIRRIEARPGSNIDGRYQEFRTDLADALNLNENKLPFVAELVEVKPEERDWRGAIERALGGHRLRLLVPPAAMKTALDWVNQRNNRLYVRLLEAKEPQSPARFMDDGFTHKLTFKAHTHREALKHLLAGIDRHCVDSPEALRETTHGMTMQGLLSGKRGFFEKRDEKPLNRDWMTGFDNRDRLDGLNQELSDIESTAEQTNKALKGARDALAQTRDQLALYNRLIELTFDKIDSPGANAGLKALNEQLETLTAPDSDVEKARLEFEQVNAELTRTRTQSATASSEQAVIEEKRKRALANQTDALERVGDGLTGDQQTLAKKYLPNPKDDQVEILERLERSERTTLEKHSATLSKRVQGYELSLTQQMGRARALDTGALAETGTEMRDIPDYLERLRVLDEEALPEKLERFLSYLNQSSDQGVTQLLANIQNEVTVIEERIADLNQTLQRVDFQAGRFLRLEPRRVTHESLRTLEKAQRQLRSDALKEDNGESHFRALENIVRLLRDASENKRTVGARALLDPRYRLQFAVSVLDRETSNIIETRTGSQGGSGGEKEIIASYILTASLSYALCPDGANQPLFGTIVLDEAFSKSSQAVAGRIISALNEFGLHPLFVTPNKEMRLLRSHTRSAILVHRKELQATLTSLSWEELEVHAAKMIRQRDEVTD